MNSTESSLLTPLHLFLALFADEWVAFFPTGLEERKTRKLHQASILPSERTRQHLVCMTHLTPFLCTRMCPPKDPPWKWVLFPTPVKPVLEEQLSCAGDWCEVNRRRTQDHSRVPKLKETAKCLWNGFPLIRAMVPTTATTQSTYHHPSPSRFPFFCRYWVPDLALGLMDIAVSPLGRTIPEPHRLGALVVWA